MNDRRNRYWPPSSINYPSDTKIRSSLFIAEKTLAGLNLAARPCVLLVLLFNKIRSSISSSIGIASVVERFAMRSDLRAFN